MSGRLAVQVLAALGMSAMAGCAKTAPADDSNFSCVERLAMPAYPAIAVSARVQTNLTVYVRLAPDGSAPQVTIAGVSDSLRPLFQKDVGTAMARSAFASGCGGKTVTLDLRFHLEVADPEPSVTYVRPNRFDIVAPAPTIETSRGAAARP